MKSAIARLIIACGVLALAISVARAASPSSEADDLIKRGFQLRLEGKHAEALELFNRAHAIAPSGKTLGQIGAAEVALHRWVDAEMHLQDALSRHDSWTDVPKNREMLEKAFAEARKQIAVVRFAGTPGAEISVEGRHVGVLPISDPVHVAAGTIHIRAMAPGRQPVEKELAAKGGEEAMATFELSLAVTTPVVAPAPVVAAETSAAPSRSRARVWSGGALGAIGLAAVGTGIGWLVVDGRPTCSAPSGAVCQNLYDTRTQGWVALGIGIAATAGGTMLLLWPPRENAPRVGLNVGPGSLAVAGRF